MDDLQLLDYFRVLNPDKKVFYLVKKSPLKQSRLDYILISESLSNLVENIYVKPSYRSDHSAVVLEVKFNTFSTGRGLWKFNHSLLTYKNYVEKVKQRRLSVKLQINICNMTLKKVCLLRFF